MTNILNIGTPPIPVHLRRVARARRLSLRVSSVDGKVSLSMPVRASNRQAVAFATSHESWLRAQLGKRPQRSVPSFGDELTIDGARLTLTPGTSRRVRVADGFLEIPGDIKGLPGTLRGYCRERARAVLAAHSDRFSAQIGHRYCGLTLRDTRSRWGSCSASGRLMYSWRLIFAPPAILRYVAAHEVSHLAEHNHSPDFWRVVNSLDPDFKAHRKWLRAKGSELHRLDFGAPT